MKGCIPAVVSSTEGSWTEGTSEAEGTILWPALREEGEVGVADLAGPSSGGSLRTLRGAGRVQDAAAIVPWPTIASPRSSTAVWPGEAPANSSPSSTLQRRVAAAGRRPPTVAGTGVRAVAQADRVDAVAVAVQDRVADADRRVVELARGCRR